MADNRKDLIFEVIKGQSQLCYFLLGLAASAIAFTIHQTKDLQSVQVVWQVWMALSFWGISFGAGIFAARFRIEASIANADFLWMQSKVHPSIADDPEVIALLDGAEKGTKAKAALQGFSMLVQQLGILAGAIAYVWGHILMMGKV